MVGIPHGTLLPLLAVVEVVVLVMVLVLELTEVLAAVEHLVMELVLRLGAMEQGGKEIMGVQVVLASQLLVIQVVEAVLVRWDLVLQTVRAEWEFPVLSQVLLSTMQVEVEVGFIAGHLSLVEMEEEEMAHMLSEMV